MMIVERRGEEVNNNYDEEETGRDFHVVMWSGLDACYVLDRMNALLSVFLQTSDTKSSSSYLFIRMDAI